MGVATRKHPDVLQNLNADSLSFLQRNLRNVQRTRQEAQETPEAAGVTVTVSGLAEKTTEQDVNQLVKDIQLEAMKVTLPQESRRKRSCGTAFVLLPSLQDAQKVVERLNGARAFGVQAIESSIESFGSPLAPLAH